MYLRSDRWLLHCDVDGVNPPPIPSWHSMSGGEIEVNDTKTHPGGGQMEESLGGPESRTDLTITRLDSTTIHPYKYQWENAMNSAMQASYTPVDGGQTITIYGILKGVKYNEKDADNAGKATVSLIMSCRSKSSISQ